MAVLLIRGILADLGATRQLLNIQLTKLPVQI